MTPDELQALQAQLDEAEARAAFRPTFLAQPPAQYDNIYGVEIDVAKSSGIDVLGSAFGLLSSNPAYNPSKAIGYTDTTDAGYRRIEVYQTSGKAN